MSIKKIAVIVGSLRKESLNRKMALAAKALAPASMVLEIAEIGELSNFNQDIEQTPPAPWVAFRQQIVAADAVLFVTPEYNRSVPGVLKNAVDIGSRPYGNSAFNAKPTAIIGVSVGALGAFGAVHHLRQSLVFNNALLMSQPEAYIGNAGKLFDDKGNIAVDTTRTMVVGFMTAFDAWITRAAA